MDDVIETSLFSARNRLTGSRIEVDGRPIDWGMPYYLYENPLFGLKIPVDAKKIVEEKVIEIKGNLRTWEVSVGIVLEKGKLKALVKSAANIQDGQSDAIIADCYQLIARNCTSYCHELYYGCNPDARFEIYEIEAVEFSRLPRWIARDDVVASHAKLIASLI